jgi:ankyrin repeat protein
MRFTVSLLLLTLPFTGCRHNQIQRPTPAAPRIAGGGYCMFDGTYGPVKTDFMVAIWQGNLERVKELIGEHKDLNMPIRHFPCMGSDEEHLITPLLQAVSASGSDRYSSRHKPGAQYAEVLELLLQDGADPNFRADWDRSPLHLAAGYGDLSTLKILLQYGARVDERDEGGETPLLAAANGWDSLGVVEELIGAGADVRAVDNLEDNTLMLASWKHAERAARLFVTLGIDPCAVNHDSETALDQAISYSDGTPRREETIRFLRPFCRDGMSYPAARSVNLGSNQEQSAVKSKLMMAILKGDVKAVGDLLGPETNIVLETRFASSTAKVQTTPLQFAVLAERPEVVEFLLQHGADPNFHPGQSDSALALAARHGNLPLVKMLLSRGASVTEPNQDGETPLLAAASTSNGMAVIDELVAAGVDVHAADKEGYNAAMLAAWNHNEEAVKLFASLNVDPCGRSKSSRTALGLAEANLDFPGKEETISFLQGRCSGR